MVFTGQATGVDNQAAALVEPGKPVLAVAGQARQVGNQGIAAASEPAVTRDSRSRTARWHRRGVR